MVEANVFGLVLGVTVAVALGLGTVALCHYLGIARLALLCLLSGAFEELPSVREGFVSEPTG